MKRLTLIPKFFFDIVGGYACSLRTESCVLLEYPGNKMIARTGIGFSSIPISTMNHQDHDSDQYVESLVDNIPALKCSLYFKLKEYISSKKDTKDIGNLDVEIAHLNNVDIQRFYDELNSIQHFKGIFSLH